MRARLLNRIFRIDMVVPRFGWPGLLDAVLARAHAGRVSTLVGRQPLLVLLHLTLVLLVGLRLLLLLPALLLRLAAGALHAAEHRAAERAPGRALAGIPGNGADH